MEEIEKRWKSLEGFTLILRQKLLSLKLSGGGEESVDWKKEKN